MANNNKCSRKDVGSAPSENPPALKEGAIYSNIVAQVNFWWIKLKFDNRSNVDGNDW